MLKVTISLPQLSKALLHTSVWQQLKTSWQEKSKISPSLFAVGFTTNSPHQRDKTCLRRWVQHSRVHLCQSAASAPQEGQKNQWFKHADKKTNTEQFFSSVVVWPAIWGTLETPFRDPVTNGRTKVWGLVYFYNSVSSEKRLYLDQVLYEITGIIFSM